MLRLATDENFNNDIVRGVLGRKRHSVRARGLSNGELEKRFARYVKAMRYHSPEKD